jgi:NAD(P)-dependent dehydrogenase (short-subunit alcohol dehydrogenase family)
MNPTYDFSGQVALVTGAASGIGQATAKAFSAAGAAVVLVDRDGKKLASLAEELTAAGGKAIHLVGDVSNEEFAKAAVDRAVSEFGRLDMAYNNAGILGPMCPLTEETGEGYDAVNAVNLRGVWTFLKHELIQMKKQGSGAIVNCSSLGGLVGLPGRAAYHATKHGVIGLTKSAALDAPPRASASTPSAPVASRRPWVTESIPRR